MYSIIIKYFMNNTEIINKLFRYVKILLVSLIFFYPFYYINSLSKKIENSKKIIEKKDKVIRDNIVDNKANELKNKIKHIEEASKIKIKHEREIRNLKINNDRKTIDSSLRDSNISKKIKINEKEHIIIQDEVIIYI